MSKVKELYQRRIESGQVERSAADAWLAVATGRRLPQEPKRRKKPLSDSGHPFLGVGEWPERPAHTCREGQDEGTVATFRKDKTTFTPIITPRWRDTDKREGCPACLYGRVRRHGNQVLFELGRTGELYHTIMPEEKYRKFAARLRKRRERTGVAAVFRTYPLENDEAGRAIIHDQPNEEGELVPDDITHLFQLMLPWLQTPEDRRVSSSRGWGGPWQGNNGDGQVKEAKQQGFNPGPVVQAWGQSGRKMARALGCIEEEFGDTETSIKEDALTLFKRLEKGGVELYLKGSNSKVMTVEDLMPLYVANTGANVTDNEHTKDSKKRMLLKRDIKPHQRELFSEKEAIPTPTCPLEPVTLAAAMGKEAFDV